MGHIKKIKIILNKTGLLKTPGDTITLTRDDLESYNRVKEALTILKEEVEI